MNDSKAILDYAAIKFDDRDLLPVIVQDVRTLEVLTLAYMNPESLRKTIETSATWFWSRSRSELWHKGATSGNTQRVVEIRQDCDSDALLVLVEPRGPACHTGSRSCFYRSLDGEELTESFAIGPVLDELYSLIESRRQALPEGSYTSYLFKEGLDKILKKIGEEATETIIAAKGDDREAIIRETADLVYHLLVLLVERGVNLDEVSAELFRRRATGKP
jgi:phosphoribosyl-ATP pyrophosphohydrolase/phosphoribosyl-AMP cyclohydrolase